MTPLERAQAELEQQRAKLASLETKRDELAAMVEGAKVEVDGMTDVPGKKLIDAYAKFKQTEATFDEIFTSVEEQQRQVYRAESKVQTEQYMLELQTYDQSAASHFQNWQEAMQRMTECLAVETVKAVAAWRGLMDAREKFLQVASVLVPGASQRQMPLHWSQEREAEFVTAKDKLIETLRERGSALALLLNPYDDRTSILDESGDMPLPRVGRFSDALWMALLIVANEPTPPVLALPDETHDVQAN